MMFVVQLSVVVRKFRMYLFIIVLLRRITIAYGLP